MTEEDHRPDNAKLGYSLCPRSFSFCPSICIRSCLEKDMSYQQASLNAVTRNKNKEYHQYALTTPAI